MDLHRFNPHDLKTTGQSLIGEVIILNRALIVGGCASPIAHYSALDLENTEERYVEGLSYVISAKQNLYVAAGPDSIAPSASERPIFFIYVSNTGKNAIDFGPSKISLVTNSGETLAAIAPEQLQREAKRRAAWARVGAGLQVAANNMNASNAGYEYGSATYSGTTNYSDGYGYGTANTYGTATYSGYNASAAAHAQAEANAQNEALIANTNANIEQMMSSAQYGALKRHTILAGEEYASRVTFEKIPGDTSSITLILDVAGETHELSWRYSIK